MKKLIIVLFAAFLSACGDDQLDRDYASSALESAVRRDCIAYPKECETAKAKAREVLAGGITKNKFYKIYVDWSYEMHKRYRERDFQCFLDIPSLKDDLSNYDEYQKLKADCENKSK